MRQILFTNINCRQYLIVTVGLLIFLTACYPAHNYERSNISTDFVAKNVTTCRQKASALIDREISLDQSYDRTGGHSLEVSFAKFDAHKQRNDYFNSCMSKSRNYKIQEKKIEHSLPVQAVRP